MDTISISNGQTVMFIQRMPITKLVTRITLGDLAQQPQCEGAAVYNLQIGQSPTGTVDGSTPNWQGKSLAPQAMSEEPGKVTWEIIPTVFRKGYGYFIGLQNKGKNCQNPTIRTWAHNESQVNGGPPGCDPVESQARGFRMWHEQGKSDAVNCPFNVTPALDPSMPTGWLRVGSYATAYVETPLNWGTPKPCNFSNYGTEPVYWRESATQPGWSEYVCRWTQFAAPETELKDGWYYAWGGRWLPGSPQDAYLKTWAEDEDIARYYKPRLISTPRSRGARSTLISSSTRSTLVKTPKGPPTTMPVRKVFPYLSLPGQAAPTLLVQNN